MTAPTTEQKISAAQEALAAMAPPRTEEDIAPNTLEAVVTVIWSQLALVPPATRQRPASRARCSSGCSTRSNPELMAEVDDLNAQHDVLEAKIAADNLKNPRPADA